MPIGDVDPQMLLAALRKLEGKGNYETAKKDQLSVAAGMHGHWGWKTAFG